jgi:hypothetical protein
LLIIESCYTQNIKKLEASPTMNQTHYPRLEIYSEIDKGDPNAGNNKWTDPSGKTVYGGKADHRLHILRKTYLIKEEQKMQLLQTPLRWLPYFGVQKENITLSQYFQAATATDRYPFYKMLPQNLNSLLTQKEKDENYPYYNTLLTYETSYPQSFIVVWLDENTWFVNQVFYSTDEGFAEFRQEEALEDTLFEGNFDAFLRLSPIFQYKLTEGFPSIKLNSLRKAIPLDEVVLSISLSPGMPNTNSYHIQIAGDASIMRQGFKSKNKIDPNKLTAILFEAQKLNWESYNVDKIPKPFAHDAQRFSISAWKEGRLQTVDSPDLSVENSPLSTFVQMVKEVPEIKSLMKPRY